MERKKLISELKLVKKAINDKKLKLLEKQTEYFFDSDYEIYMENIPSRPDEPERPKEPEVPFNHEDRFLEEDSLPSFDEYKNKYYVKTNFVFDGWKRKLTITCGIIGVLILIIGLMVIGNGNSELKYAHELYNSIINQEQFYDEYMYKVNAAKAVIRSGVITLVIGGCVALIPAIISLVAAYFTYKNDVKKNDETFEENFRKNNAKIEKRNNEKVNRRNKAKTDYENYEKSLVSYREKVKEYEKEYKVYINNFEAYQNEYNSQLKLAKNNVKAHNQNIESIAEKDFAKAMSFVEIEFPEKYHYAIDKIIDILEDLRADSLKEAINVLKEDEHKEKLLEEQRRLVDLQEEYNLELERQGEENARYQQRQESLQRERMIAEQRNHEESMSFQRQQARQQQELERRRYEEQRAYQREQENRQREAERRERDRINSIRSRCVLCANRFGCSIKNSITSACPSFRSK